MDIFKNFSYSTVATAPSPATSGTSLVVAASGGALFPAVPFNAVIWPTGVQPLASNAEVVRVTGVATDTLTIVRAQEGSGARTVVVGDQIADNLTADWLNKVGVFVSEGWSDDSAETWTYASATTFTVAGDLTAKYSKGTRLKLTQTTVKYFVVVGSSHAGGTTTVTITGGSDYTFVNAAVSLNYHSYMENPQGWPGWFNYTVVWGGFSSDPVVATAHFNVSGRVCNIQVRLTGGGTSNATSLTLSVPIASIIDSIHMLGPGRDNAVNLATPSMLVMTAAGTTVTAYKDPAFGAWTNGGGANSKSVQGSFAYAF